MHFFSLVASLVLALWFAAPAVPAFAEDEPLNRPKPDAQAPSAATNAAARPAPMPWFDPFAFLARGNVAGNANASAGTNAAADAKATASSRAARVSNPALDAAIARHAAINGLPAAFVHRVVMRESRYNPHAVGKGGTMGLMQIKHATARGVGYRGSAAGLLDAETNLTYGVKYLAGAYRAAGGNHTRAVALYARGYYHEAKRSAAGQDASAAARPSFFVAGNRP